MSEARLLRALFEERSGLTQSAFGQAHDIGSAAMVWQYLSGRRPLGLKVACKFARALGVPLESFSPRLFRELRELIELAGSVGEGGLPAHPLSDRSSDQRTEASVDEEPKPETETKRAVSSGTAGLASLAFYEAWLAARGYESADLASVVCPDESMEWTLHAGDSLILDRRSITPLEGVVFAMTYEGAMQVRRLVRDDGDWWLDCDHADKRRFGRKRWFDKHCFIIGRVVFRQGECM